MISRHRPGLARLLISLAIAGCVACASPCPRVPRPTATTGQLVEGRYELTLVATRGSQRGSSTTGQLTLLRLPAPHWGGSELYGFTDIDLDAVGAPWPGDDDHVPLPTSRDPQAPGVLVENVDFEEGYPDGAPVLLMGTVSNRNPAVAITPEGAQILELWPDGEGIGLWVHEVPAEGFIGRWREWGIVYDGRGKFCARRMR